MRRSPRGSIRRGRCRQDEPSPAFSVAHWAGFADNRQGEMPALRVTDSDASTGHPLASRAEDAVDLTGARIAARQRTRIRHELVTTHAVGAVGPIGAALTGRSCGPVWLQSRPVSLFLQAPPFDGSITRSWPLLR